MIRKIDEQHNDVTADSVVGTRNSVAFWPFLECT